MATPMAGRGPNSPSIKNVSVYKCNGKMLPRDKKFPIPSLGRDTKGNVNLGFGNGR